MSILIMMREGGSLGIDTIGNLPIDEDLDYFPDASSVDYNPQMMLWSHNGFALQYLDVDSLLLLGAE